MRPVKRRDYRSPASATKEGHGGRVAVLLVLALALTGCRFAGHCFREVPEPQRADVLRYTLEKGLLQPGDLYDDELALADSGTPPARLSEAQMSMVRPWAVRYAQCVRDE